MAKNKIYSNINPYPDREEEIRKAKGNPNKNNHSKKKNSNYGGYTAGTYMAGKLAEKAKQQEPEEPAEPVQPLLRVQRGAEHSADDQGHHNQYRAGNCQLAVRQRKQRAQSAGKSCHAHDQPACQHDDFLIPRAQLPAEHDARVACHDHGQHVYDQSQYCHRKILLIPPVLRLPLLQLL